MTAGGGDREYWHVREPNLDVGGLVLPGRWGSVVLGQGAYGQDTPAGHAHFYRELFLELFRVSHTSVPVSRLNCAYVYEEREDALEVASGRGQACYRVRAADPNAARSRHDMLWITWMSEPGTSFERVVAQAGNYWRGVRCRDVWTGPDACQERWEWLIAGPLVVTGREQ